MAKHYIRKQRGGWWWRNPFYFPPPWFYVGCKGGQYEVGPFRSRAIAQRYIDNVEAQIYAR